MSFCMIRRGCNWGFSVLSWRVYIRVIGRWSIAFWAWALDGDLLFSYSFFVGLRDNGCLFVGDVVVPVHRANIMRIYR